MKSNINKLDSKMFGQADHFIPVELCIKITAVFCLINIALILPDLQLLFGSNSLIHHSANDQHIFSYQPIFRWITGPLSSIGIPENVVIFNLIALYIMSFVCMFFNKYRFASAIVAWFIHLVIINSNFLMTYGADNMITVLLLINILFCYPYGTKEQREVVQSFAFRFLQVQMCFIYFFGGLGKALGVNWFDGNAMWFMFNIYAEESVPLLMNAIDYPIIFKVSSWTIVFIELLYPILIYTRKIKKWILVKIVVMHALIAIIMGLYTFGAVMIIMNLMAFGHYFNWRKIIPGDYAKYVMPRRLIKNIANT